MPEEAKSVVSWYDYALRYLAMKWPHAAPNTRDGINESLTSVTMELLGERPGRPSDEVIRKALRNWAFVLPGSDDREVPDDVRNVLHWVSKASRPLADLAEPATAHAVLDSLKLKLDGTAAAAETVRRKRRTLVNAANYAVDLGELRENPITTVRRQKPKVSNQVDPRLSPTRNRRGISWRPSPTWADTGVPVVVASSVCSPRCTSAVSGRRKRSVSSRRT
ncbi:hypothetical protein FNQ90_03930 [Streptomyces alkaliphilus]|uniref:Uncharacterized protein n=1 Tax=Streptomyces alkaliphilus TaxID=1472722 RepID=A0A7W3Y0J7_9ACTN|nr:hypothetical protein [Streptomyces alkaliphilus]